MRLHNCTCLYCGSTFVDDVTKEHVVGRRFVPKGSLNGCWNLIANACRSCNGQKSSLEDDVSAITMAPDATGSYPTDDFAFASEAERKARRSTSRRTRKPVAASGETQSLVCHFADDAKLTLGMVMPPQVDNDRVFELARYHVCAFFYCITYDASTKKGGFWPGEYMPLLPAARGDWGNSIHVGFMKAVQEWTPRLLCITAGGNFKAMIRRHPQTFTWAWALEWNQNYRVVGFAGDTEEVKTIMATVPPLKFEPAMRTERGWVRFRLEVRLPEESDTLFSCGPISEPA